MHVIQSKRYPGQEASIQLEVINEHIVPVCMLYRARTKGSLVNLARK